jgi:hypothetical protein
MNEYEVCIENILAHEDKTDFAMVTSVGNNLSFTVWVDELKPSLTINPAPDSPYMVEAIPVVAGNEPSALNKASGQSLALESESIPAKKWKHGTYYLNSVFLLSIFLFDLSK